jgi:hypothetical protein
MPDAEVGLGGGQALEVALDPLVRQSVVLPDQEVEQVREEDILIDPGLVERELEA